jgi:hypothetical protein
MKMAIFHGLLLSCDSLPFSVQPLSERAVLSLPFSDSRHRKTTIFSASACNSSTRFSINGFFLRW